MAHVHKSTVTLRIIGEDLIPAEITTMLGASPTHAVRKGDTIVGRKTGHVRIAKTGIWNVSAPDREPENIDGQIEWILDQLTQDLTVWQRLTKMYRIDLFCGLFMHDDNEGMTISPRSLVALGERGIELGLDIYYNGEAE
jgi:hypothetical protein